METSYQPLKKSERTELEFVKTFCPECELIGKWDFGGDQRWWRADRAYAVILVKAGRGHYVFVNVRSGQQVDVPKGISHITKFKCVP